MVAMGREGVSGEWGTGPWSHCTANRKVEERRGQVMADLVTAGGWRDSIYEVTNHQVECEQILSPRRVKEKYMKRSGRKKSTDLATATDAEKTETQVVYLNHCPALLYSLWSLTGVVIVVKR